MKTPRFIRISSDDIIRWTKILSADYFFPSATTGGIKPQPCISSHLPFAAFRDSIVRCHGRFVTLPHYMSWYLALKDSYISLIFSWNSLARGMGDGGWREEPASDDAVCCH